jgi:DNA-binding SARP family transcriptional activator
VSGESEAVASCLVECGLDLVREGELDLVVEAASSLPESARGQAVETVLGDALLRRGEWDGAMAAFDRAGGGAAVLPAALAWRIGLIQHERGDVVSALATYARADMTTGDAADLAQVAAWRAICMWQREEIDEARENAQLAITIAERSESDQALAAAQAAVGAVAHMDGETQASIDAFRKAIRRSERAGDVLMEVRFRTDLGYVLGFVGRFAESLTELDLAVARGAALGHSSFLALAMSDRGHAHLGRGHFEEAEADFAEARRLYELLGSTWVAYPTLKQANVHQLRGETAVARGAYREVIANAEALHGAWFLAEAILGLAAATVDDDPGGALRLVDEAMARASSVTAASTPLGAARVALAAGRADLASDYAERSRKIAERRRDRPSLAGALEVQAQTSPTTDRARMLLHEAEAIWMETGSPYGLARHELVWAEIVGGPEGRSAALHAAEAFRQMGASRLVDQATMLADRLAAADRPAIEIRSLGPFQVLREGSVIPVLEWQSKKARDLLKVLVSRRGRAMTREGLCELLWPDEDPAPLLNRLSVALATIRSVLDPGRRLPADHFIRADKASVSLDLDHVAVDLEAFFSEARNALRGLEAAGTSEPGASDEVHRQLAAAETAYRGDYLEEDPYEDWASAVRDEARETYLAVARAMAARAGARQDADNAVRLYLRILDHDPYDEDAHLGLVDVLAAAGRHGEARRRYGVYTARMEELDLEAASYPAVRGRPPDGRRVAALSPA